MKFMYNYLIIEFIFAYCETIIIIRIRTFNDCVFSKIPLHV